MATRREFITTTAAAALSAAMTPAAKGAASMQFQSARPSTNRRIVLAARPRGEPVTSDFRIEEVSVPELEEGEILLQTLFLSLDPYMRGVMEEESDDPNYASALPLGSVMVGGTVSRVIESRHPEHTAGDLVLGNSGWQAYEVSGGGGLETLERDMENPSYALGVLGMPGFAAYHGLLNIGVPRPGETLVLAAATGAVGSVVGQLGKMRGCRVVGLAGSPEKIAHAEDTLGYDVCINRRDPDMAEQLREACPDGVDVYFENVGGPIFDAVLPLLNQHARIPVCGLIAVYNEEGPPPGPDRLPRVQMSILSNRIKMQGYIISDHYVEDGVDNRPAWRADLAEWIREGHIHYREDVTDGLENAPETFIGLFRGENFGKTLIRVAT